MLSAAKIRAHLSGPWEGDIIYYDSIPSTQTAARELLDSFPPEGTAIVAGSQRSGQGRLGRSFFSHSQSGLYLSYLKKLPPRPKNPGLLTSFTALALSDLIESHTSLKPKIKWPNDVLVGGKKVSGILTHALTKVGAGGAAFSYAIIGIGLNVNYPSGGFPKEIAAKAAALTGPGEESLGRALICAGLLEELDKILILKDALNSDAEPYLERLRGKSSLLGKKKCVGRGEDCAEV